MSRAKTPILLLALAAFPLACGDPTSPGVPTIDGLPRVLTADETATVAASNRFAFDLLRETVAVDTGANTFLSPLSVSMALGMAMNGADGDTWSQMRDALGFEGLEEPAINAAYRGLIDLLLDLDPSVEIALGNALWSDAGRVRLLDSFVERVEQAFDAEAATLDFDDPASVDVINDWVSDVTNGRIDGLLEEIPWYAVAYLVNAIYFDGDWRTTFDRDNTRTGTFTRADGSTVRVPMMRDQVGYRLLSFGSPDRVQGVELPYGGGAFTAVALLPPRGEGIATLLAGLDVATWDDWMRALDDAALEEQLERAGTWVALPKLELEWKASLVDPLMAGGIDDAFVGAAADFSRMNGERDLFITDVIHQTFLKVDEEGTEAAAATAVEIGVVSAPPVLAFDRPFLFAIRERFSGTILFLGVIGDPS